MIDFNEFKENEAPETEEEDGRIYLTDEQGKEYPFDLLDIIPYASANSPDNVKERRVVNLRSNEGKWFKVSYSGGEGYVHQSMLGVCTSATEDGDPVLLKAPRFDAASKGRVADGMRARPLAFFMQNDTAFLNVEILEGPRKGTTGWLPEQSFTANPYSSCWRR